MSEERVGMGEGRVGMGEGRVGMGGGLALGTPRIHLRRTDSTNERMKELARNGAPHGTLVTAEEQTAGRGRHGRRWFAPPRSALLMSLLLRWAPSGSPPPLLPLRAGLAVCDVVGDEALVKWPNDVVARRQDETLAKLAGVLIEGRPGERWLVLGIGLNVAVELATLPEEARAVAGTLGRSPDAIEPALDELLRALERRLRAPAAEILVAWRSRDALLGSDVTFGDRHGRAEGVDEDGRLLVRSQEGTVVAVESGEVLLG